LLRGEKAALGDQKAVGCDAQAGVMMEAAPVAALVVAEAEFLLEFLIVPLDPPACLGDPPPPPSSVVAHGCSDSPCMQAS
jgi:hypothetical protein